VTTDTLPAAQTSDVSAAVAAVLDRRLSATSARPLAVALSGGGDSVALLLAARDWAAARGRPLTALTVDHRLQPQSRVWTEACAELARSLGLGFRALVWEDAKPERGLPAAARQARHRLLAQAARDCGARVVLMGHTADDVAEARAMREAGATTPEPREWSPSPAWPDGRGLFLARPLLGLRRAALRPWLRARGARWIEDPANADLRYARARARSELDALGEIALVEPAALGLAGLCRFEPWGGVAAPREALRAAAPKDAERWLGLACVCAGGASRLPSATSRERLTARVRADGPVTATLAGARIEADASWARVVREAGEARRDGLRPQPLAAGEAVVWDGRFELTALDDGLEARLLRGLARRLAPDQQRALAALPAAARPGLPTIIDSAGQVSSPLLGDSPVRLVPLVEARLRAAAGLVAREPDGP
jgi:tRNA(Ile)-lysidine synthase